MIQWALLLLIATAYAGEDLSCLGGDSRGRCEIYDELMVVDRQLKSAERVLGSCEHEDPYVAILIRADETWAWATSKPEKAYNQMNDFLRDQHWLIDDKHTLKIAYHFTTRDGMKRDFHIMNDMDLWSAFQLQRRYGYSEFYVEIHTDQPTSTPTTQVPTSAPTVTYQPTSTPTVQLYGSEIMASLTEKFDLKTAQGGGVWLNTILDEPRHNYSAIDKLLYRASDDGYTKEAFQKAVDGKGPFILIIKEKANNYVFGAYSAVSWKSSTKGWVLCDNCFLWVWKNRDYPKVNNPVATQGLRGYPTKNRSYATYMHTSNGPTFGNGNDLILYPSSATASYGTTNWGAAYATQGSSRYYPANPNSSTFYWTDYEIYSVTEKYLMGN